MEIKPHISENKLESKDVKLEVFFSKEREVVRIKNTLSKIRWYREQGYKLLFPLQIISMLDNSEEISLGEIESSVSNEFKQEDYEKIEEELKVSWEKSRDDFMKKLTTLGRPLYDCYKIYLTKYGVGGSYRFPDTIVVNFLYNTSGKYFNTVKHEIIHLTIQDLIEKYSIQHWVKERIVDLTYSRFFEGERGLQNSQEKMEEITTLFDSYFPDIEKIISEVGKISKYIEEKGK